MATSTLANSPDPLSPLIDELTEMVIQAEKPKPPQPAPAPQPITEKDRQHNAAMLLGLWQLGEQMAAQAFELSRKPDPLTIALNGFPDVHSSRAYYAGND